MKRNFLILGIVGFLFSGLITLADKYSTEYQDAYRYAYTNGITTVKTIDKADMNGTLTRIAMAKMMSQYAMNVLGLEPDTTKKCAFKDVPSSLNAQYNNGATLACQLGLMGIGNDGNVSKKFNPNDIVTRGQWATVFSRALSRVNGDTVSEGTPFYKTHMDYLQSKGIIKSQTSPSHNSYEKRGNAMVMMMRSVKNVKINDNSSEEDNKQRIEDTIKDYNGIILKGSELRPNNVVNSDSVNVNNVHGGYTIITVDLTGGTMYVDDDYNFILKISGDGINIKTLELTYNDFSKLVSVTIRGENGNHVYYTKIYSWENYLSECKTSNEYGFSDLETNFKIWGGNDKYIFIIRSEDRKYIDMRMKLFTSTDSLKELVEKKHCDCKSCKVS